MKHLDAKRIQGSSTAVRTTDYTEDFTATAAFGTIADAVTVAGVTLSTADKKLGTGSLDYDGASGTKIRLGVVQALPAGTADYTYAFWVKFDNTSGDSQVFKAQDGVETYINSGDLKFKTSGGYTTLISSVSTGTWYHIIIENSGGTTYGYYNGGNVQSASSATIGSSNLNEWYIGGKDSGSEAHDGHIDDFAIWHRALTSAERTALYNSGTGALATSISHTDLKYYLNCDAVDGKNDLPVSNVVENTIFEETDTKSHWWLQGGQWKGGAWIPTLDGATADTDGVTRTQSTSGSGVGVWTTSSASTFTLDTGNQRLNGYQGSNTGVQSMYTKMPHKLSTDSWQIDWTVILDSGHNNNTAVFLTLGSFTAIGYSPSPAEGHEYLEIVANQGNTDARWHTRCRAYPTGGSLSSITYGSQGSGGQNGGTYNSSTTYFRMTGTSTTVTVQAFTDSARTTQLGSDDVLTYDGTQFGLGNSQYIGVATDDFHLNMDIKDIKVTGFVA